MEGTPARTTPCKVLKISNIVKLSPLKGVSTQSNDAANIDATIICLRPTASEIEPKIIMLTAKANVVKVRERLEVAGVTLKASLNSGISGCAVYKIAKVLKPAAKNAIDTFLNAGVPFSIKSISSISISILLFIMLPLQTIIVNYSYLGPDVVSGDTLSAPTSFFSHVGRTAKPVKSSSRFDGFAV